MCPQLSGPMQEEAGRHRYAGSAGELAAVLRPFADSPGWLAYEEKHCAGAVQPKVLLVKGALLNALKSLQDNLSFAQKSMLDACRIIGEEQKVAWRLSAADAKQQPEVLARRLRLACRHIAQARARGKPPAWVKQLLEASTLASAPAAPSEWVFFGWDIEQEAAWRATGDKHARREHTTKMEEPVDAKESCFMLARFADDSLVPISDMLVGEWRQKALAKAASADGHATKAADVFWKGTHVGSGLPIKIKARLDRAPLVSIFAADSQICQVPASAFADSAAAAEFLRPIAEKFAKNEVARCDIYSLRNSMAKERGLSLHCVLKKPAAAEVLRPIAEKVAKKAKAKSAEPGRVVTTERDEGKAWPSRVVATEFVADATLEEHEAAARVPAIFSDGSAGPPDWPC